MTPYWIHEGAEEHHGQFADEHGAPLPDFSSRPQSTARVRWRRPGVVPPQPDVHATFEQSPRELFERHEITLWHMTVAANLPGIVAEGGIVCDACQRKGNLETVRLLDWPDIPFNSPSRTYVPLAIADRAELQALVCRRPREHTIAILKVADAVLDAAAVRFFPGWPELVDLSPHGQPGLSGTRGASWLLSPRAKPWVGSTVFVPEYVDLSSIEEVNLIDPLPEDESVHRLDWPEGCHVQAADPALWGLTPCEADG